MSSWITSLTRWLSYHSWLQTINVSVTILNKERRRTQLMFSGLFYQMLQRNCTLSKVRHCIYLFLTWLILQRITISCPPLMVSLVISNEGYTLFFVGDSTFCCINLKQQVEKTQKSAEAGCLKMLTWLNCFFIILFIYYYITVYYYYKIRKK